LVRLAGVNIELEHGATPNAGDVWTASGTQHFGEWAPISIDYSNLIVKNNDSDLGDDDIIAYSRLSEDYYYSTIEPTPDEDVLYLLEQQKERELTDETHQIASYASARVMDGA